MRKERITVEVAIIGTEDMGNLATNLEPARLEKVWRLAQEQLIQQAADGFKASARGQVMEDHLTR